MLKKLLVFALIFSAVASYGQLDNFNLQVQKTDETCIGNGTLSFEVSNTAPGASLLYKVFLLPDVTNAVAITTSASVGSLVSGNYKIVAIQALNNESNSADAFITISNNVVPPDFNVTITNQNCAGGGNFVINATGTDALTYEVISGPVTRPVQASNVFEMLPTGNYIIRVTNSCGAVKIKAFTFATVANTLVIGETYYPDNENVACNSIAVSNLITPSTGTISYPLSVQHRLWSMSMAGEQIVINQTYATGASDSLVISATLPRYDSESYTYDLIVTDNCETVYEKPGNVIVPAIGLTLNIAPALCGGHYLKVTAFKHTAPFSVEFVTAPEGFGAGYMDAPSNGLYAGDTVEFGNENTGLPSGNYVIKITDACGRVAQGSLAIVQELPQANVIGENNGCFSPLGRIRINVGPQHIISAAIIEAPPGFSYSLPHNVNNAISAEGKIAILNLPLGSYKISFTDDCGFVHTVDVEVPPFTDKGFTIDTLPDCTAGYGTIKLRSGNGNLVSAVLLSAPAAFGQNLPYDVTAFIDPVNGDVYMNHLPPGTYVYKATDVCGTERVMTQLIYYAPHIDNVIFTPECGSFSIDVTDSAVSSSYVSYWLQKFDPASGTWGHPDGSNYGYPEGATPTVQYGIRLVAPLHNIVYTGSFRVLKKFEAFNNGVSQRSVCLKVLHEFTFDNTFSISNAFNLACAGSPNDVYIEAEGTSLIYRIEKKDGAPHVVNNGNNNVFTNLEPSATYVFSVEDLCGNKLTKEVNMRELPSIADATQPDDITVCEEMVDDISNYSFRLKDQDAAILGTLPGAVYTITYHLSQADADANSNPLPEYYTATHNGQTIYARLVHNEIGLCHGTTSFKLFAGRKPEPNITATGSLCEGGSIYLTAPQGFSGYLWSTGQTTRSILVTEPGIYGVLVQQGINNRPCDGYAEIVVAASVAPELLSIVPEDWTYDQNMITVNASGMDNLLYSIDGLTWQESNVFTGLESGLYTVFVKDAGGCGMESGEVVLLNYPKFFTPNGDGYHERWRIKFSVYEPNLLVNIYDRYGKIVGSFDAKDEGWDGTFNGAALPSTDYWFVVKREDGRELKGHFAMLR